MTWSSHSSSIATGLGSRPKASSAGNSNRGRWPSSDPQAGLKLAIWTRKSLAHDSGLPLGKPSATEFALGHGVSSKAEVDRVMEQGRQAGAVIVKPAQDTFWGGYAGYFQDPDQDLWEVAWNPQWSLPQ
jgi:catechol 2,3-dioxygenase-like lactoylglutathione lyase family enzyme